MKKNDADIKLCTHLSYLGMGFPATKELEKILEESFTPKEARVALALPTKVAPLNPVSVEDISKEIYLPHDELSKTLENLSSRGLLYSGLTAQGKKGYALHQMGYGFPQVFFWKGEKSSFSRQMARLVTNYRKAKDVNYEAFGTTKTKNYRYIPPKKAFEHPHEKHVVLTFEQMETVIQNAKTIAVSHCSCRMRTEVLERRRCHYETEVCIKFDELAEYVVERGLGRKISHEEALEINRKCEKAGLVHMVENSREKLKHACNGCSCCCWSVGTIKRRITPRDVLIATYYIRETDAEACAGCGLCADICPVDAVCMEDDLAIVDKAWCIGCGLCIGPCPSDAARLKRRTA